MLLIMNIRALFLDCGGVPNVPYAGFTTSNSPVVGTYTVGTTATYTCLSGYRPSGVATISCLASGWETPTLQCIEGKRYNIS